MYASSRLAARPASLHMGYAGAIALRVGGGGADHEWCNGVE